jgi:hypothetical protein
MTVSKPDAAAKWRDSYCPAKDLQHFVPPSIVLSFSALVKYSYTPPAELGVKILLEQFR